MSKNERMVDNPKMCVYFIIFNYYLNNNQYTALS